VSALGVVGIMSYAAAGLQDIVSSFLIEKNKTMVDGEVVYNFDTISVFWIEGTALTVLIALIVWK